MSEYEAIFTAHIKKLYELRRQEQKIRAEIASVSEMIKASFSLMSDEERNKFMDTMQAALEQLVKEERGLTDAIRNLLESRPREWFDAVKVRDKLVKDGFDFSGYTSNPLASIHTVLKRFKRTDVKVRKNAVGMKEYRSVMRSQRQSAYPPVRIAPSKFGYYAAVQGKLSDMK
jgi:hypothetical protein